MIIHEYRGYNAVDPGSVITSVLSTVSSIFTKPQPVPTYVGSPGIFGIPKVIALIGGGVLVLGAASFIISRKRKGVRGR